MVLSRRDAQACRFRLRKGCAGLDRRDVPPDLPVTLRQLDQADHQQADNGAVRTRTPTGFGQREDRAGKLSEPRTFAPRRLRTVVDPCLLAPSATARG